MICLKAMEKPPERRYQSMREFADDLHRYLSGDVILARPAGPVTQAWRRIRSHPVISAAAGTALLAALVMAAFLLPGKGDRTDLIQAQIDLLEKLMEGGSLNKTGDQELQALKRKLERQIEALKESMR